MHGEHLAKSCEGKERLLLVKRNSNLDATDATIASYSYENGIEFNTDAFSKLRWMQFAESRCWTYKAVYTNPLT
jgi:hypothetical protein